MDRGRREFLGARALGAAVRELAGEMREVGALAERALGERYLVRARRRAMACQFEVLLDSGEPENLKAAQEALDEVDRLEDQLSVYRESSEISEINRRAASKPVAVEPELFDLLQTAGRISAETEGAFDITAGPLVKCWGFYRRQGRMPANEELTEALRRVGMRHIELDRRECTVRFRRPGMELNLGSIGKGCALDRAASVLTETSQVRSGLLHGGRSSVYALGSPPGESGWLVGIVDPSRPGERAATVRLRDRGLATSGTSEQFFEAGGRRFGHLLDPRSGRAIEGLFTVTVLAPTAAEADALSTAFAILGREKAGQYCETRDEIGAIFVNSREIGRTEVALVGLRPHEVELGTAALVPAACGNDSGD